MQSCFTGFGDNLQALDRSATQGEKVIVDTDFIDTQNLGPDSDQDFLYRVARRYKGFFTLPLGDKGIASRKTKAAGIMERGSLSFKKLRKSSTKRGT